VEVVSWELVAPEDRQVAFQGKILFTGPSALGHPGLEYISWEETWRRYIAYGPLGVIYTNRECGSLVLDAKTAMNATKSALKFQQFLFGVAEQPGISEVNTDEYDHTMFAGYMFAEIGSVDGKRLETLLREAKARNETVIGHLAPGGMPCVISFIVVTTDFLRLI
jgi:hypothetical protein